MSFRFGLFNSLRSWYSSDVIALCCASVFHLLLISSYFKPLYISLKMYRLSSILFIIIFTLINSVLGIGECLSSFNFASIFGKIFQRYRSHCRGSSNRPLHFCIHRHQEIRRISTKVHLYPFG